MGKKRANQPGYEQRLDRSGKKYWGKKPASNSTSVKELKQSLTTPFEARVHNTLGVLHADILNGRRINPDSYDKVIDTIKHDKKATFSQILLPMVAMNGFKSEETESDYLLAVRSSKDSHHVNLVKRWIELFPEQQNVHSWEFLNSEITEQDMKEFKKKISPEEGHFSRKIYLMNQQQQAEQMEQMERQKRDYRFYIEPTYVKERKSFDVG